jgi:pyridoxine 4-dehydrogenase
MALHSANGHGNLTAKAAGTFTMAEDLTVTRMGYGAMQLAGPHVFGPPADRDAAIAVLRENVAAATLTLSEDDLAELNSIAS